MRLQLQLHRSLHRHNLHETHLMICTSHLNRPFLFYPTLPNLFYDESDQNAGRNLRTICKAFSNLIHSFPHQHVIGLCKLSLESWEYGTSMKLILTPLKLRWKELAVISACESVCIEYLHCSLQHERVFRFTSWRASDDFCGKHFSSAMIRRVSSFFLFNFNFSNQNPYSQYQPSIQ
jgi:hypothetical protein